MAYNECNDRKDRHFHGLLASVIPFAASAVVVALASNPLSGADDHLASAARIIVGDTIAIGRVHVRLYGIDAPESEQSCEGADRMTYACGSVATAELRQLIGGRAVACERRDTDRYGRLVAVCWAGAIEINRAMVRAGWAIAYRYFSVAYVDEETEARAAHRGIWQGAFQEP